MRTNIDINEALLKEAMEFTGLKTKKAIVEEGLNKIVLEGRRRRALRELQGIGWDGDLEQMRREWTMDDFTL